MKIVMDSDCLVKLTKAGAKETVIQAMEVHIPHLVKKETVDDAKNRGYRDAFVIEENIDKEGLHVVKHRGKASYQELLAKGENEALSLYLTGGYDAIASDDRRFLKKLEAAGIPFLTPTACIIYLYKAEKMGKKATLDIIDDIKPFISSDEYLIAKFYLEGKV